MCIRHKNETGDLKLHAVAGTQTVLLAFDITKTKVLENYMGFSVSGTDSNGTNQSYLKNQFLNGFELKYASLSIPETRQPFIKNFIEIFQIWNN